MTNKIKPWGKLDNAGTNKPWPSAKAASQEITVAAKPWPTAGAMPDCGHTPVVRTEPNKQAIIELAIDNAEVVPLKRADITAPKQVGRPFRKGVSGNAKGRPKGSKHKITELARSIIANDFEAHGEATLARVRVIDPVAYLKLVLHFVPKQLVLEREKGKPIDLGELTDKEFIEVLKEARKRNMYERILVSDAKAEEEKLLARQYSLK